MKVTWEYSPRTEALRLLHAARQIATGFYRLNGFPILPYGQNLAPGHSVQMPDLPYLSIPRFWERSRRIDIYTFPGINMNVPEDLVEATQKLLESHPLPTPNLTKIQKLWAKHGTQIMAEIYKLMPHHQNKVRSLTIWPTNFGTGASFSVCQNLPAGRQDRHDIVIWLRTDQNLTTLVESILTSLTRHEVYQQLHGLWSESEILVDWLTFFSPLGQLLKKIDPDWEFTPTIRGSRAEQNATILQKSQEFIKKIGVPHTGIADIKNLSADGFTSREKQILDLLISKSPQVTTFDELGNIVFAQNPDQFSLYALTKIMQRLRDKLESHGISGSFIQTKRGEGYLLVN